MLLFVLWYANVVLILVVLFVLLRNLIKLLVERRHRILGSTFKFKLVATYVGLSLIPVLVLFAIATELLQGSIDRWFNTPLAAVLERGNTVAQGLYAQVERTGLRDARRVLAEIEGIDLDRAEDRPRLIRALQDASPSSTLDFLAVYQTVLEPEEDPSSSTPCSTRRPASPTCPSRAATSWRRRRGRGTAARIVNAPGVPGRLVLAAVANRRAGSGAGSRRSVVAGTAARSAARRADATSWCATSRTTASSRCRRTTCGRATSCSS